MWISSESDIEELIKRYEGYRIELDGTLEIREIATVISTIIERLKREHIINSSSAMISYYVLKENKVERKIKVKDRRNDIVKQKVVDLTDFFSIKEQTKIYMVFEEEEIIDELMFNCEMPSLLVNCTTFRELARDVYK